MSFCEYLISGTSFKENFYNYETYQSSSDLPSDVERIKEVWDSFSNYMSLLVLTGLGGAIAGGVVIFGTSIPLLGVALLIASLAFTIFSYIRSSAAKHQLEQWNENSLVQTPDSNQPTQNPPPGDLYPLLREPLAKCVTYYETLTVPVDNKESFLEKFFAYNPLERLYCPEDLNKEVSTAHKLFLDLVENYRNLTFQIQHAKKVAENELENAKGKIDVKVNGIIELKKTNLNSEFSVKAISSRKRENVEKIRDYAKDVYEEKWKAIGRAAVASVQQSLSQYLAQDFEKEKSECITKLFGQVATFVAAFKKQDFSSFSPLEKVTLNESIRWVPPEISTDGPGTFTYDSAQFTLPYDSSKLPGISEAEFIEHLKGSENVVSQAQSQPPVSVPAAASAQVLPSQPANSEEFLKNFVEKPPHDALKAGQAKIIFYDLHHQYHHLTGEKSLLEGTLNRLRKQIDSNIQAKIKINQHKFKSMLSRNEQTKKVAAIIAYGSKYIEEKYDECRRSSLESIQRVSEQFEKAKGEYIQKLMNQVTAFVDALKKQDFTSLKTLDEFAFVASFPEFTYPDSISIPYDSAKLPGITEEEWNHCFNPPPSPVMKYFETLKIPSDSDPEAFLKAFFENNPLDAKVEMMNDVAERSAHGGYLRLKAWYSSFVHHGMIDVNFAKNLVKSDKSVFELCKDLCSITLAKNFDVSKKDQIQKYLTTYLESYYRTFIEETEKSIEDSFELYKQQEWYQKERRAYIQILYQNVVSLIDSLKKKNLTTSAQIDSFKPSQQWKCPEYNTPILFYKDIPYNSEELPGISEAEYNSCLGKK